MTLIGESTLKCDVGEACACIEQPVLSRFYSLYDQILVRRQSDGLLKGSNKVLAAQACKPGKVVQIDVVGEILNDEFTYAAQMPRGQSTRTRALTSAQWFIARAKARRPTGALVPPFQATWPE